MVPASARSGAPTAYHIPFALRLRGALDVPALRGRSGLVARHEALRTRFVEYLGGLPGR